jgi:hypothetical protein
MPGILAQCRDVGRDDETLTKVNMARQNFPLTLVPVTTERTLETVTTEDFRSHQGTRFRLTDQSAEGDSGDSVEVELADVTEYPDTHKARSYRRTS